MTAIISALMSVAISAAALVITLNAIGSGLHRAKSPKEKAICACALGINFLCVIACAVFAIFAWHIGS